MEYRYDRKIVVVPGAIKAPAAIDEIVASPAFEGLGNVRRVVGADQDVVEMRAAQCSDAAEGVSADRVVAHRTPRRDIDCHRARRIDVAYSGVVVAGDLVVAGHTLELVEAALIPAPIGAVRGEGGCVEDVRRVAATDGFDAQQRVGAYDCRCRQNRAP